MIKSCTLIPTHPPKFYWLNNLLRSYMEFVKKPHDFYVVFSNDSIIIQGNISHFFNNMINKNVDFY